jgi:seryl-tRNA synthetase
MLDRRLILEDLPRVERALKLRGFDPEPLLHLRRLVERRLELIPRVEELRHRRRVLSEEIGRRIQAREDPADLREEVERIKALIREGEAELAEVESRLDELLLSLPNLPLEEVPPGKDSSENQVVRTWGEIPSFSFERRPHWEVGLSLGILEFEKAREISGSRFYFLQGIGALLELHLALWMFEHHVRKGYQPLIPPYLVLSRALIGTGQLPRFAEELFKLGDRDLYLIPTAEVPVTNLHRDEILPAEELPKKYVAFSPCFRAEAGAHGQDTRGIIRVHQFHKIELVRFEHPQKSRSALEEMTADAEEILKLLELPYRVVKLCTGDLGFASAMTYDLEVYLPGQRRWLEVSSSSLFTDFQARRLNARFREHPKAKPELLHTLNASGLAVGRTIVAILENYQNPDGSLTIPSILRDRLRCDRIERAT